MATNVGKNEHGREITYTVTYGEGFCKFFNLKGKRFNKVKVIKECKSQGIKPPVMVSWITLQKWGWKDNRKRVTWEE